MIINFHFMQYYLFDVIGAFCNNLLWIHMIMIEYYEFWCFSEKK